jgi:hypothetical protein
MPFLSDDAPSPNQANRVLLFPSIFFGFWFFCLGPADLCFSSSHRQACDSQCPHTARLISTLAPRTDRFVISSVLMP